MTQSSSERAASEPVADQAAARPVLIRHCGLCGHAFVQRRRRPHTSSHKISATDHSALRRSAGLDSDWASSPSCPHCGHTQTSILDSAPTMAHGIDRARRLSAISRGGAAEAVALAAESAELLPVVDPALAAG